jgi:S-adenosylmethionine decarboxylase
LTTFQQTHSKPSASEHCSTSGTVRFVGSHLIIEMWDSPHLTDADVIDSSLRQAVADCGATLLSMHLHEFSPNGGISGVGILAESHISIHTWPEFGYAALDLFTCGTIDPYKAVPALRDGLEPGSIQVSEMKRGIMP